MAMSKSGWHIAAWGFWGWAETVVKGIGIGAGLLALVNSFNGDDLMIGDHPRLAALVVSGLLTLFTVVALGLRSQQREIISLIFAILNFTAHVGVLLSILRVPDETTLPIVLGVFIFLGELVKQRFLAVSGYTEAGQTTGQMLNFSRGVSVIYVLLVIFLAV